MRHRLFVALAAASLLTTSCSSEPEAATPTTGPPITEASAAIDDQSEELPNPDEIEIGGTWLAATAQRTPVNTEAKRLLLGHAFDAYGVQRVAICTDARNERSRTAILRIGATFEGVLRRHRPRAGTDPVELRDRAMYSVIADEWPSVRARLDERLAR